MPGMIIKEGRVCTSWDRARKTKGNAGLSPSWERGLEQADGVGMVSLGLGKHEPS